MQIREISADDAASIADRQESHVFDFKSQDTPPRGIEKLVVAFSNADGGELYLGISDKKVDPDPAKRWVGFSSIEDMNNVLQALFLLSPSVDIRYSILKRHGDSRYVLEITVEKNADVCKTSDNTVYVRHGAQSLPIRDPARIAELGFAKGAHSFEDAVLNDIPPEYVVESIELRDLLISSSPNVDPLDFVVNQNLIDAKNWSPRVAAVLLFSVSPSAYIPKKCAVKVTRYQTSEDDPERDHLAEQFTIEGPAYQIIQETVRAVKDTMSSVEVWTPEGRKQIDYPPEAIWETIVNAVIHRDYSISDDIQILIFDNRIEILSPGRLPGYVTVENILEARYSRNPKIVRTLARYKNPPNKDLGEGLNTAFQKMKEWGFKEPEIFAEGNYVKVVLPHARLATPIAAILEFLNHHSQITNRQARELTGIKSENLVKIEFYKLRDEGLIERVPDLQGPKSAWRLTDYGLRLKAISANT